LTVIATPSSRRIPKPPLMANRIRSVEIRNRVLNPAEAEFFVHVVPERASEITEIRGHFRGPVCVYASTVEVRYPLQTLASREESLRKRVIIPEPSWWEPATPFLYNGTIELWEDGKLCDGVELRHGLRVLRRRENRLLLNGRVFHVRGTCYHRQSRADLVRAHQDGINTLLVPVASRHSEVWKLADELGFLVIVEVEDVGQDASLIASLAEHASSFGRVYCGGGASEKDLRAMLAARDRQADKPLVGVCWPAPEAIMNQDVDFVVCDSQNVDSLSNVGSPILVLTKGALAEEEVGASRSSFAGWICNAEKC
jgi:Glycosyl hydrolases family 2